MDIQARKRTLRRAMVAQILDLAPSMRRAQNAELLQRFPSLPGYSAAGTVLLYATAFREEISTEPLLEHALSAGKQVILPRVDRAQGMLVLCRVEDPRTDLVPGTRGIPEPHAGAPLINPVEVDWALVPGLVFDARCYRLGRGAGHYDRLLPTLRTDVSRWALAYDCQWTDELPVEPHDVPLDGVVSPSQRCTRERAADDLPERG